MHGLVRSVWYEPAPPGPPKRVWRDWALVAVLVPAALLEGLLRADLTWPAVSVAVTIALVPTLLWRRTRPLVAVTAPFAVTTVVPWFTDGEPVETWTMGFLLIVVYAVFRWGSGREAVIGLGVMTGSVLLSLWLGRLAPADVAGAFVVMSAAVALGVALRYRARARLRELDQIKLLEREQLARDLHDTVAHHVSAMAIRAQAGLATSQTPGAATDALRVIEAEASRALAEMRAMVHLLRRDGAAELTPGRHLTDLRELASHGYSGLAVEVEVVGDLDGLPAAVEAAIFRIAQESVTNARRHARNATRIEVRAEADAAAVRLRVSDDGEPVPRTPSSGYGIVGMAERAGLLGGTCQAGPDPGGGWTVTAVLPRAAS
ncbi:two-component sensor histidine kinase [Microtetraspora sp. NBRC 13810]|uniref:sensor histidine kinase n=1 Tax=Microtetraspora sp. NBRC 13810 TaxID=3030990 RepID=UPI0024A484D8|nr:histidine kinase [Microtetraspora sp. NBRC 13810]GLW11999.1 two-component sensor histidine kinase [Microtetraspora sp. NBRC 13810]